MSPKYDKFGARAAFETGSGTAYLYRLNRLEELGIAPVSRLPFSIKVLLESALRSLDGYNVTEDDVIAWATYNAAAPAAREVPFMPARVLMQDYTGVPCMVDLAAMRDAMHQLGKDPRKVNPLVPTDLVIDHSIQIDAFGSRDALMLNSKLEFERNYERYEFLRWAQTAFQNYRVVPPRSGIVHQVNLEYLAKGVQRRLENGEAVAFPDSLVGTDSHSTMINGLGVVGWGVGGIEAEAVMLGQPYYMLLPEVIGFKLTGRLPEGTTATDLVLVITQILRKKGVVDKFVEFFGEGLSQMSLPDRATIANMAPDYGATMSFFPVDHITLDYLRRTGRTEAEVQLVERYCKEQGLFRTDATPAPTFTDVIELDLGSVEPSVAGPKRPQDRVRLGDLKRSFEDALSAPLSARGYALSDEERAKRVVLQNGQPIELTHGAVVIASITSCTNTSNPSVMLGAGLLAKKAVERGLQVKPYVKTSLAPGSRVVTEYLTETGLMDYLEQLGFHVVGYGCTTCIGNSGPLPEKVAQAVTEHNLVAAAVLSGNRNFEGRINPLVKANYLASPPLVVAFALAGTVAIDLEHEPIGYDKEGKPVFLRELWYTHAELEDYMRVATKPEVYRRLYDGIENANEDWNAIPTKGDLLYSWSPESTYIQRPPYFDNFSVAVAPLSDIRNARVLVLLGDSITTDHISPAGNIAVNSPAGQYLLARGVRKEDFNQYGTRRGNDQVMVRGTFANIRIKNLMLNGVEGGYTRYLPTGEQMSIYDAAMRYKQDGTPLLVIAGKEYGTGSSRDWAAKGTALLGVKAVLAESFERIHRGNLVGMGVLPLQFKPGESAASYGLTGEELYHIEGIHDGMAPRAEVSVRVQRSSGETFAFSAIARLDSQVEIDNYRNGGILPAVLRKMLAE
ncbi:MAG: aconitate hydratase AcnA [Candidatus Thermofonsia Clade 1 bacterium]|uniref:Aconitate hydratase n=1 Tax=Candidatus Thermofonsia Clade 1 bacterium TaxID=2364210 RepID=A0A2M8PCB2_9CHLR|nr:MAG: aconitate hydratase AcnA [Candidatus Thermofonsia Clade 1 bacterium]RMF50896.1 MAG: aconitate hydratase AcnA [Chloroflexota bacterium]